MGIGELASTREARERDDGNERRARAGSDGKEKERASLFLPFPSLPSSPLSLIINSNIPQRSGATVDEAGLTC